MITRKTVFILGAGASIPYGFPSGADLRKWLCNAPARDFRMLEASGISEVDVRKFAEIFARSGLASIDAFLAKRFDFAEIGRKCIAAELCRCERDAVNQIHNLDNADHWYELLWQALTRDAVTVDHVAENSVKFITFNYDRSLECYLFHAIKNSFNTDDAVALKTLDALNIVHVYGEIAKFGSKDDVMEGVRAYGGSLTPANISIAARGIRVIPDARAGGQVFRQTQDMLAWAEVICFLGFGFDFLNLTRLAIPEMLEGRAKAPTIVASVYEKTDAEIYAYQRRVCPNLAWTVFPDKNAMALRRAGVLL